MVVALYTNQKSLERSGFEVMKSEGGDIKVRRSGFTLIELIMVIVILGVLAAVAIPKFVNLTQQAELAAEAGVFGGVKAALAVYYAEQSAAGITDPAYLWPKDLETVGASGGVDDSDNFFAAVLKDPVQASDGWDETGINTYKGPEGTATYTYTISDGRFTKS